MLLNVKYNKARVLVKGKFLKKTCLLLFYILNFKTLAQETSVAYTSIVDSKTLVSEEKIKKIDSLFKHYHNKQNKEQLAIELKEFSSWLYRRKDYKTTIEYVKQSIALYETLGPEYKLLHRKGFYNLGVLYYKLEDYKNSNLFYLKLIKTGEQDALYARAHSRVGINFKDLGDLYRSLEYHDKAKALLSSRGMIVELINNRIDVSNAYRRLSNPESVKKGIKALQYAEKLIDSLDPKVSPNNVYKIYANLGNLQDREKTDEVQKAIYYYNKAFNFATLAQNKNYQARALNNIGTLYIGKKKDSSLMYFNKALNYLDGDTALEPRINYNISDCYFNDNNFDKALSFSQKAFNSAIQNKEQPLDVESVPKEDLSATTDKWLLIDIVKKRALIWYRLYENENKEVYLKNAMKLYFMADYLVDLIRMESIETKSKLFWRETASDIYSNATKICHALNDPENGFYFMEKNKAVLLVENTSYEIVKSSAKIPKRLITRDLNLRKNMTQAEEAFRAAKPDAKETLKETVFKRKEYYAQFVDSLKLSFPEYHYLKRPIEVLGLNEINTTSAVIEYIIPEETSTAKGYGLFKNETNVIIFELEDVSKLNKLVTEYISSISKPFFKPEEKKKFEGISNALYQVLFPEGIRSFISDNKITIVPDGLLQSIPFEALITDTLTGAYFIESSEISYAYSITFLAQNQKISRNPQSELLGFAPIEFKDLTKLPKTEDEIKKIQNHLKHKVYLGNEATSSQFLSAISDFNVIHLATHADASDSIAPWIAFSDRKMNLSELYTIKLQAELVFLSACNTSIGKHYTGEGVMSLARGFFSSGANSVISSLWNVDDRSTNKIVSNFYKNIKQQTTKSKALRKAKLNYIYSSSLNETSPYYWASFILIGDTGSIEIQDNNTIFLLVIGSLFFTLLLVFYRLKVKAKKR